VRRALLVLLACVAGLPVASASAAPPIKHVFVITLENKGFDQTFGPGSAAPYLSQTLTGQGQLLTQYYGTGHASLDNYNRDDQRAGAERRHAGRLSVLLRLPAGSAGERRPVRAGRAACTVTGEDARGSGLSGRPHLEGLHGGHGHGVPAPGAQLARHDTAGDAAEPVRRAAQPVRLLPLDHRLAGLRAERGRPVPVRHRPRVCGHHCELQLRHA